LNKDGVFFNYIEGGIGAVTMDASGVIVIIVMKDFYSSDGGKYVEQVRQTDLSSSFIFIILMSFSPISRTVDDIVGKLTKAEVIGCLPRGWIRTADCRNWKSLKEVVDVLSNDMKGVIYEAACTKDRLMKEERIARKKRKRSDYEWTRRLRRRVNEGEQSCQ
jgi:hypothetical protein